MNFKELLTNFSFVIISNLTNLLISSLAILIIPKVIGVREYGYWQLYAFYISYAGFFHLGWPDGIYLRYGGVEYENLDKDYFFKQIILYNIYLFIVTGFVLLFVNLNNFDTDKSFIYYMASCNIILLNIRVFFVLLLQATNEIKKSSLIVIIDRIIYVILMVILLSFGTKNYKSMIISDIIAKISAVLYSYWVCRDFIKGDFKLSKTNLSEVIVNISVGINLMLSNIASMLIIGVVRFGIEKQWSIEVFGKVSLTLSISNLLMLFVNAVGVVIFPVLKKAKEDSLPILYSNLRNVLMMILLLMLILYYPIIYILARWLPNYSESLSFMVLVFPMAIFEGKMALLVNTYMKALRMEKTIFKVNIFTLLISVISTFIFTVYFKNLELTVLSIVFLLAVRCFFAEYILSKILVIKVMKDILLETILTIIFVLSGWFIGGIESFLLYLCAYCLYLVIKGKDLSYLIESTTLFKNN